MRGFFNILFALALALASPAQASLTTMGVGGSKIAPPPPPPAATVQFIQGWHNGNSTSKSLSVNMAGNTTVIVIRFCRVDLTCTAPKIGSTTMTHVRTERSLSMWVAATAGGTYSITYTLSGSGPGGIAVWGAKNLLSRSARGSNSSQTAAASGNASLPVAGIAEGFSIGAGTSGFFHGSCPVSTPNGGYASVYADETWNNAYTSFAAWQRTTPTNATYNPNATINCYTQNPYQDNIVATFR